MISWRPTRISRAEAAAEEAMARGYQMDAAPVTRGRHADADQRYQPVTDSQFASRFIRASSSLLAGDSNSTPAFSLVRQMTVAMVSKGPTTTNKSSPGGGKSRASS